MTAISILYLVASATAIGDCHQYFIFSSLCNCHRWLPSVLYICQPLQLPAVFYIWQSLQLTAVLAISILYLAVSATASGACHQSFMLSENHVMNNTSSAGTTSRLIHASQVQTGLQCDGWSTLRRSKLVSSVAADPRCAGPNWSPMWRLIHPAQVQTGLQCGGATEVVFGAIVASLVQQRWCSVQ